MWLDSWIDMMKLIVAFCNFVNVSKIETKYQIFQTVGVPGHTLYPCLCTDGTCTLWNGLIHHLKVWTVVKCCITGNRNMNFIFIFWVLTLESLVNKYQRFWIMPSYTTLTSHIYWNAAIWISTTLPHTSDFVCNVTVSYFNLYFFFWVFGIGCILLRWFPNICILVFWKEFLTPNKLRLCYYL